MDQSNKIIFIKNFFESSDIDIVMNHINANEGSFQTKCRYNEETNGITAFNNKDLTPLLQKYKSKIENYVGLKLIPKYNFWRLSFKNGTVPPHIDRPPCEVSVTINIGTSDNVIWPFYLDHEKNIRIDMSPGDAVIYRGYECIHWRYPLTSEWNAQFCLHYTNANGVFSDISHHMKWNEFEPKTDEEIDIKNRVVELARICKGVNT